MYKYESSLPCSTNFLRQDTCTWWKREQYMAIHTADLNFSGQMSGFYPTVYPVGYWHPWSFNMGMNNANPSYLPYFESGYKFCKVSRKCDKTDSPGLNKISEKGFQAHQIGPMNPKPIYSAISKHGQCSPKLLPPPIHQSLCFKQQRPLDVMQISPVHNSYSKPNKNPFNNCNSSRKQICRFCLQNGEIEEFYSNHVLKDRDGKVLCPILRKYVCNICNATGDFAHTKAYCPLYKEKDKKPLAVILKQTFHDSSGRIRK